MENQDFVFKKHTGKETKVRVINETLIDAGGYGDIYDALISIGGIEKRFIIKRYRREDLGEKLVESVFEHYKVAREAGLKVFPTFRLGDDGKSILMTSGFSKDQVCIGRNTTMEKAGRSKINDIENIDEFLSNFFDESIKAARQGIKFPYEDLFFFLVSKEEPTKIDFVLGDLDFLAVGSQKSKNTAMDNLDRSEEMLEDFFARTVAEQSKLEEIERRLELFYKKAIADIRSSTLR